MAIITKNWPNGDKLTLDTVGGAISVTSDQNTTGADRQMDIIVKTTAGTPQQTKTVTVVQARRPPVYLYAWGSNDKGQLGTGDDLDRYIPSLVSEFEYPDMVSAGGEFAFVQQNGRIRGAGLNAVNTNQLGLPTGNKSLFTTNNFTFPVSKMASGSTVSLIISGGKLFGMGAYFMSGSQYYVQVGTDADWTDVSANNNVNYVCLMGIRAGKLYAWGRNASFVLALPVNNGNYSSPTQVGSWNDWSRVSVGPSHSLGICAGKLYAWGRNANGRTGLNISNTSTTSTPTQVGAWDDWEDVCAFYSHSIGLRAGKLYAWGYGLYGRLGLGNNDSVSVPTQIGSFSDWTQLGRGLNDFALAIRAGKLYAWGNGLNGRLGLGNDDSVLVPTQIGNDADWILCAAGHFASYAVKATPFSMPAPFTLFASTVPNRLFSLSGGDPAQFDDTGGAMFLISANAFVGVRTALLWINYNFLKVWFSTRINGWGFLQVQLHTPGGSIAHSFTLAEQSTPQAETLYFNLPDYGVQAGLYSVIIGFYGEESQGLGSSATVLEIGFTDIGA